VLLGARRFGNVVTDAFDGIFSRLEAAGAELAISANKSITYRTLKPLEPE